VPYQPLIIDEHIGRAIAIAPGEGTPGSMNFDLGDDLDGYDGSKALLEAMQAGVFGKTTV
jgi:hypothetical protein